MIFSVVDRVEVTHPSGRYYQLCVLERADGLALKELRWRPGKRDYRKIAGGKRTPGILSLHELGKADRALRKGPGISRAHLHQTEVSVALVAAFGADAAWKLWNEVNLLKQTLICREEP